MGTMYVSQRAAHSLTLQWSETISLLSTLVARLWQFLFFFPFVFHSNRQKLSINKSKQDKTNERELPIHSYALCAWKRRWVHTSTPAVHITSLCVFDRLSLVLGRAPNHSLFLVRFKCKCTYDRELRGKASQHEWRMKLNKIANRECVKIADRVVGRRILSLEWDTQCMIQYIDERTGTWTRALGFSVSQSKQTNR